MSEHTPTPWDFEQAMCGGEPIPQTYEITAGESATGELLFIADAYSKNDAAFIVRACNAYDDLYEALERAQEELRLIRMKDCGVIYDIGLRTAIELALAKARGES